MITSPCMNLCFLPFEIALKCATVMTHRKLYQITSYGLNYTILNFNVLKVNINFKRILSSSSSSSFCARTSSFSLLKMCCCVCCARMFQIHAHVARVCVQVCWLVSALSCSPVTTTTLRKHTKEKAGRHASTQARQKGTKTGKKAGDTIYS